MANFQKAVEGDSSDPDYQLPGICAMAAAGQFDPAVESLRAAEARKPDDAEATARLGCALKREGPRPGERRPKDASD